MLSYMSLINRLSFLLIVILIVLSIYFAYKKEEKSELRFFVNFTHEKLFHTIVFFLVLAIGVILRTYRFPEIPEGISQDSVMSAVDAKALATYATDRFGTFMPAHLQGWTYSQQSSLHAYIMVPFVSALGLNTLTMRLPQLIISIIGLIMIYVCIKSFLGKSAGLIAMAFTAINPWHFMQSRWAIDCNVFPHIFIIGFALLMAFVKSKKKASLFVSMAFFGLSMYGYGVSFFFVPIFLLIACIYLLSDKLIKWLDVLWCVLIYFFVSGPEYIVMILNYFKLPTIKTPFFTMQYFPESVRSNDLLISSGNVFAQLKINFGCLLDATVFQRNLDTWDVYSEFSTIYKCSLPLLFAGLAICVWKIFKDKEKRAPYALIFIYYVGSLILGLLVNGTNIERLNVIQYANILLIAISIDFVIRHFKASSVPLAVIYLSISVLFVNAYYKYADERIHPYMFVDFERALEYAREKDSDRYFITPDTKFEGAANVSEIISLFVFDVDSHYWRNTEDCTLEKGIPYNERYMYVNLESPKDLKKGDVCVFRLKEDNIFDNQSDIEVKTFGSYGVAIRK